MVILLSGFLNLLLVMVVVLSMVVWGLSVIFSLMVFFFGRFIFVL